MGLGEEIPKIDQNIWESEDLLASFFNYTYFLRRHIKRISLIVGLFILLSIVYALAQKRTWQGQFQIVLSQSNDMDKNALMAFVNPGRKSDLKTEVIVLKSPSVLMPIFQYVKKEKIKENKKFLNWKFNDWSQKSLFIGLDKGTSVLNLAYQDTNKELIIPVLEKISKTYQTYAGKDNREISLKTLNYLEGQIAEYKKNTFESLNRLQSYGLKNNLSILDNKIDDANTNYLTNIEQIRLKTVQQLVEIKRQMSDLNSIKSPSKSFYYASQIPYLLEQEIPFNDLNDIDYQIIKLKEIYTDKNEILISKINERKSFIENVSSKITETLEARKILLQSIIKGAERDPGVVEKYKKYFVDYQLNTQTLKDLTSQYTALKISALKDPNPWKLITNPTLLDSPVGLSKKRIVIFGTLLGSFIGMLYAFFFDLRKNNIYYENTMSKLTNSEKLFEFNLDQEQQLKNSIIYLSQGLLNLPKGSKLCIVTTSNINSVNINKVKKVLTSLLINLEVYISDDLINIKDASKVIFLTSIGFENKNDVTKLINNLNLMSINLDGWINYILPNKEN